MLYVLVLMLVVLAMVLVLWWLVWWCVLGVVVCGGVVHMCETGVSDVRAVDGCGHKGSVCMMVLSLVVVAASSFVLVVVMARCVW